jgi:hypothetical protein
VTLLAHGGHWITTALYVLPVVLLLAIFAWEAFKNRRPGAHVDEHSSDG